MELRLVIVICAIVGILSYFTGYHDGAESQLPNIVEVHHD